MDLSNLPPTKELTIKLGAKVPAWMNGVTVQSNSIQNTSKQNPPSLLQTVQNQVLNVVRKPPKSSVPVQQVRPIQTPNGSKWKFEVSDGISIAGRDANHNQLDTKGPLIAGGHSLLGGIQSPFFNVQSHRKLTQKQKRQLQKRNPNTDPTKANDDNVDDDKPENQMGVTETYADYKPSKLKIGHPHPDQVVETSSLSSIEPNDITYELNIPKRTIDKGCLSALQLESIVYASQAHQHILPDGSRAGFLIGDGAGVGKGRTVAGVIFENFQLGRNKAIWISVSNDLKYDAERDLEDIGAPYIEVHPLNKLKYAEIDSKLNENIEDGVIFSTYQSLISGSTARGTSEKYNTRLKQLVEWCGGDKFDGVIIFDECHKAKHLITSGKQKPTKTGEAVLQLQLLLPLARVVYASATGASEPRNMAYMVRLGLWGEETPFKNFMEFLQTVEKRGVSTMEVIAMDMKLRGMYIARQLSFKGVTFQVDEVPLSDSFRQIYNDSIKFWVEAKDKFDEASVLLDDNNKLKRSMWGQFWGAHQRFFKYLCIASKVSYTVKVAKDAVKDGKCVVIGLQSTGEARTVDVIEQNDGDLDDFVSTSKAVLENLIEKQFPAPSRFFAFGKEDKKKNTKKHKPDSSGPATERNSSLKRKLSEPMEIVGRRRNSSKKLCVLYSDDDSDDENIQMDVNSGADANSVNGKKKSSGSDTDSDSEYSNSDESSEMTTPDESESSFLDGKAPDHDDDDDESDDNQQSVRRRPRLNVSAAKDGHKTMQIKVQEIVGELLAQPSSKNQPGLSANAAMAMCKRACDMKEELFKKIDQLGDRLPGNTLDQLIDELGGPDEVAEMTGRKGRVVKDADTNEVQYESRCPGGISLEKINIHEKDLFMKGEKLIAIISEAASNGISLQSDRRVKNQKRRVHITLELPWSADRAIQQFGRTHRSNQMNAPEYIFLISDLAGERRFAASVSKRLESLGALTHGDRRATESRNLAQFNVDNKYGRDALRIVLEKIFEVDYLSRFGRDTDADEERHEKFVQLNDALKGVSIEGPIAEVTIAKFLNRILGLPVHLQNYLFDYFMETLDSTIDKAKREGKYDLGIMDLGNTDNAEKIRSYRFMRRHATGVAPIEVTTVALERGMSWEEALKISVKVTHDREGFYRTKYTRSGKFSVFLALLVNPEQGKKKLDSGSWRAYSVEFKTHRPHLGTHMRTEKLEDVIRQGVKITPDEAQNFWEAHYNSSVHQCSHIYWNGRCPNKITGLDCDNGMRRRRYTTLSGSLFAYWSNIEHYVRKEANNVQIRMIRLKITDGSKIVGVLLPDSSVEDIIEDLRGSSIKTEENIYKDH